MEPEEIVALKTAMMGKAIAEIKESARAIFTGKNTTPTRPSG